jgi:MoaA/NifB/PqqE/SkfB family radical SAM enzyme
MKNILNFKDRITDLYRILNARFTENCYPIYVQFLLTFRCNFRCKHCDYPQLHSEELSYEQICIILDDLINNGLRKISFVGGEPLLRPDLPQILDYIKSKNKNIFCSLTTNGFYLDKFIDKLNNIDLIMFSLDGPEHIHNKLRQPDSYKYVIKGIELCKQNNIPVYINTVISKTNIKHIDFLLNLTKKHNIKILFQPIESFSNSQNPKFKNIMLSEKELKYIYYYIIAKQKQGYNIGYSEYHFYEIAEGKKFKNCRFAGKLFCSILPDGSVAPCNPMIFQFNRNWPNLKYESIKTAMQQINNIKCKGCFTAWAELNEIFKLKPKYIIKNIFKSIN